MAEQDELHPFHASIDSAEIIESTAGSVRVLTPGSLSLLAHLEYDQQTFSLKVNAPSETPSDALAHVSFRLAYLALLGAFIRGRDGPASLQAGGPPTIDVLFADDRPPLTLSCTRAAVLQLFSLASSLPTLPPLPYIPCQTQTSFGLVSHPLRPHFPVLAHDNSFFYSRWIPHLRSFFALRPIRRDDADLDLLMGWMNSERVNEFWGEKGDREKHRAFIAETIDDPHTEALIGSYVDDRGHEVPACFAQAYWSKEDRLAEHYEAADYDRGIHVLVGSEQHRGKAYLRAWLPSIVHYCFLSDPRTDKVVAEPNIKNEKMLGIFTVFAGMKHEKTFSFPHKDAALMVVTRSAFFEGDYL